MAEEPGAKSLLLSEGFGISEGSQALDDPAFLYGVSEARGTSTPAAGDDALLISSNLAQAGPSFASTGQLGYFETADTPSEFYEDGGNNEGMFNNGVVDTGDNEALFLYVHHSTSTDEWSLGYFLWGGNLRDVAGKQIFGNSASHFHNPGSPLVQDDPDDGGNTDFYGTDSNGDGFGANRVGAGNGDGAVWTFDPGTFNITVKYQEHPNYGPDQGYIPVKQIRFRGPNDTIVDDVLDYGNNYTYTIDVP